MIKMSVIITTYNWPQALETILLNLIEQLAKHPSVELVIADDGSGDSTQAVVDRYKDKFNNFQHIWHEDNGFRRSAILNKSVAASKGEYLLFLDGDCLPFPDYISQQLKLIEKGYFIAGNRVLLSKEFSAAIMHDIQILNKLFSWNPVQWIIATFQKKVNKYFAYVRLGSGKWRYLRGINWKYPKGCNFCVSRDDYIAINGFDEAFIGWGHEDSDLFIRLIHSGVKIKDGRFAVPVLHLWHKEADRGRASANKQRLMEHIADPNCIKAEIGVDRYL